ncbi:prepilin-type N-terminal cleavage/methylation domain-containing protein, partial [bacterium]|nr:prepilin-type N-terminal cleavage/methylation domain-containing protein [bacterium]
MNNMINHRIHKRHSAGFTLLELVIVISLVTIMAGAVSIGIASVDRDSKLGNAANRALADLRY